MNPYEDFQDLVGHVPDLLQPLLIALAGAVPYIEGEGSAALGVIAGIHPAIAATAGATGNIICVTAVVLLSSRVRTALTSRRAARAAALPAAAPATGTIAEPAQDESKGRTRLRRFVMRFGVPGASLLGPLALPTQLTAATLVASGVTKTWVLLWQVIAIVLWTTVITLAATGALAALTH